MASIPAEAYELFASGDISAGELLELENFSELLEKSAAMPQVSPTTALAGLAALTAASPVLSHMGAAVDQSLTGAMNNIRFRRDLERTVEVNPQLGSADDPNLRMAFKTLQTSNPEYAKDPLIAGTILDMVMSNRMDPHDPASAPRFDPSLLSEIRKNRGKTIETPAMLPLVGRATQTAIDSLE